MREMPLFPLGLVLFPGGPLRLRIFETRYLDMIRKCMREDDVFGVVLISEGNDTGDAEIFDVGTTARIRDWHTTGDGLLGIAALGEQPFRVLQTRRQRDGLVVGTIDPLPADDRPLESRHDPAVDILRRLLPLAGDAYAGTTQAFEEAGWVSGRLAELLPVDNSLKQRWLEISDPIQRLDDILTLVLPDDEDEDG